jgi:hypothetical protein
MSSLNEGLGIARVECSMSLQEMVNTLYGPVSVMISPAIGQAEGLWGRDVVA